MAHRLSQKSTEKRAGTYFNSEFHESRLKEQFELAEVGLMLWIH